MGGTAIGLSEAQMTNPPYVNEPSEYQLNVAPAPIATLVGAFQGAWPL